MKKLNSKKNINQAMKNVKNAIEDNKPIRTKINKNKKRDRNINKEDILLLTEIYETSVNKSETLRFKNNIKNIIQNDVQEWLNNNFSIIAKNYTKKTFKSLNIEK